MINVMKSLGYSLLLLSFFDYFFDFFSWNFSQTYVNNLNVAEDQYNEAVHKGDITRAIALQSAIKFNGGGHINHSIFWTNLAPPQLGGGEPPSGEFKSMISLLIANLKLKCSF